MDGQGGVEDWEAFLKTNPSCPERPQGERINAPTSCPARTPRTRLTGDRFYPPDHASPAAPCGARMLAVGSMHFVPKFYAVATSILLLLVVTNAVAAGLRTVADFDMGWHLATGRYVVQQHAIPDVDVLSYPSAGKPWIYPPLAGVVMYLIYSGFGYAGLSWFCALACVLTVAYLIRNGEVVSAALAMCAVEAIAFRTGPRADLFNTVFFAIFIGELWALHCGSRARLWLLPVIMMAWVNVHPGFILGIAVILAYLLVEGADLFFAERRSAGVQRLRQVGPWVAATAAVTLANPWGPKLYRASFALAGVRGSVPGTLNTSAYISEFLPVPLSRHLFTQLLDFRHPENGYSWLIVVAILAVLFALWQKRLGAALVQASALYLSLQHARYIGLFCITTVTLASTLLGKALTTELSSTPPEIRSLSRLPVRVPLTLAAIIVSAFCGIAVLHIVDFASNRIYVTFHTNSRFGPGESSWFPERAAHFIEREKLPANIFEEFALGGFAAWRLGPAYPNFIDGRADHLNPTLFAQERGMLWQTPDAQVWQSAADQWGINVLLISEAGSRAVDRLDALAFCQSSAWRPVYMDEVSLVLLRNVPKNRPWIDRLQIDCQSQQLTPPDSSLRKEKYDFYLNAGGLFYALRRDRESEEALLRALTFYPADPNANLLLAQLYQRERQFNKAEASYRDSLGANETDAAWYGLGSLYTLEWRLPEAEHAMQRAAGLSVAPCIPYMALAQIDLALGRPTKALDAFAKAEEHSPYRHGGEALAPALYAQIAAGRAEAHRVLRHFTQAIQFQQDAVRLTPNDASRWNQLADLYDSTGQMELSAQARQKARDQRAQEANALH